MHKHFLAIIVNPGSGHSLMPAEQRCRLKIDYGCCHIQCNYSTCQIRSTSRSTLSVHDNTTVLIEHDFLSRKERSGGSCDYFKMDDKHIKILNWFEKELLLSLNVQCLLAPLRKNNLITSREEKNLEKFAEDDLTSGTTKAPTVFLRILKTKGPDAFGIFLNVLREDREHMGHKSLYSKLVQHKHGNLPRSESEPADSGEKLILTTPIRHNSLKNTTLAGALGTNIGRIVEEGVEARLEQICKRLQSLEEKIDSFIPRFGEQHSLHGAGSVDKRYTSSEIAGLPSLQPAVAVKVSSLKKKVLCIDSEHDLQFHDKSFILYMHIVYQVSKLT